jgi:hypothetical protein
MEAARSVKPMSLRLSRFDPWAPHNCLFRTLLLTLLLTLFSFCDSKLSDDTLRHDIAGWSNWHDTRL